MREQIPMNAGLYEQMRREGEDFKTFLQRIDSMFTARTTAAKVLGMSRRNYYRALTEYGISEYR